MAVTVLREAESYRLIGDENGRRAVVEARNGRVYSLAPHHRAEAADTPEGMAAVVGPDGWHDAEAAEAEFDMAVRGERRYSERIW